MEDRRKALAGFAALLRRHRAGLGHANAHAFFAAQGGAPFFGCSYRAYLNVEQGKSLPQPALAEKLIATLWVAVDEPKAREFVEAYLRALFGRGAFADFALDALAAPDAAPARGRPALHDEETVLAPRQARLLYDSEECYWCFTALANDARAWDGAALAAALGYPTSKAAAALKRLAALGLVSRDREGGWSCPFQGRLLFHPKDRPYPPRDLAALRRHWERMARRRGGEVIQEHPVLTRCSEAELRPYLPYLMHSLLAADRLSRKERSPDTGFFLLELSAERLLPF